MAPISTFHGDQSSGSLIDSPDPNVDAKGCQGHPVGQESRILTVSAPPTDAQPSEQNASPDVPAHSKLER